MICALHDIDDNGGVGAGAHRRPPVHQAPAIVKEWACLNIRCMWQQPYNHRPDHYADSKMPQSGKPNIVRLAYRSNCMDVACPPPRHYAGRCSPSALCAAVAAAKAPTAAATAAWASAICAFKSGLECSEPAGDVLWRRADTHVAATSRVT